MSKASCAFIVTCWCNELNIKWVQALSFIVSEYFDEWRWCKKNTEFIINGKTIQNYGNKFRQKDSKRALVANKIYKFYKLLVFTL